MSAAGRAPRDDKGQFLSLACPLCDCGTLRHQGGRDWACDGLLDPGHDDQDLLACPVTHTDGQPRPQPAQYQFAGARQ